MCSDTRYGDDDEYDEDEGCEVVPWPTGWTFDWYAAIKLNTGQGFEGLPDVAWPAAEQILVEELEEWLAAN